MRFLFSLLTLCLVGSCIIGCGNIAVQYDIHEDGSARMTYDIGLNTDLMRSLTGGSKDSSSSMMDSLFSQHSMDSIRQGIQQQFAGNSEVKAMDMRTYR